MEAKLKPHPYFKKTSGKAWVFFIAAVFSLAIVACDKEDDFPVVSPSNLVVDLVEDANNKGQVSVDVVAENANYYSVKFEEGSESEYSENREGKFSYTYTTSGTHRIFVRAHASGDVSTLSEQSIVIDLDSGNIGNGEYPTTGYTTPNFYNGYNLIWEEQFDGAALDETNWNYEFGTGQNGWGNAELQHYLRDNLEVANGYLTITATRQEHNGSAYTSSRITTKNKKSFKYGRMDIRAAMPFGQGLWPAIWMLGDNFDTDGWPNCGEIDIMEMVGGASTADRGDNVTHGTVHWDSQGSHAESGKAYVNSSGRLHDEWHVYSIVWDDKFIRWYFDDNEVHSIDITPADLSEFHNEFFFILNVAVGGNWPGNPDQTTEFPQKMHVDYIRVFQVQ